MEQFLTIARITKTRGIHGEVSAEILTDFPDRFAVLGQVCLQSPDGLLRWETIERHWFHRNRVILKFLKRETPDDVRDLVGCELRIPEAERVSLPEGMYFDDDLIGCEIFEEGTCLGRVHDIFKVGAEVVNLVVVTGNGSEFMIPLVSEFIASVDLQSRIIEVGLPPGLRALAVTGSKKTL